TALHGRKLVAAMGIDRSNVQPLRKVAGIRPAKLVIFGHSYDTGTGGTNINGNTDQSYGWASTLRDALGGPVFFNFAFNGGTAFRPGDAASFSAVLQNIAPTR